MSYIKVVFSKTDASVEAEITASRMEVVSAIQYLMQSVSQNLDIPFDELIKEVIEMNKISGIVDKLKWLFEEYAEEVDPEEE